MKFEIRSRWSGWVLFSLETESLKLAVEAGVKSGANLRAANLRGANLRGANLGAANLRGANLGAANLRGADLGGADLRAANLRGADLRDANLRGADLGGADLRGADLGGADLGAANLRGANLRGANLGDANLRGANLGDANLRGADLRGADLRGADLRGADVGGANLRGANLRGADLRGADLTHIRDDLWAVLSASPAEVFGLRSAIAEGRINGSQYDGVCACLVGTLANVRRCDHDDIPGLTPNSARPAELFFLNIKTGDTPETSQFSMLALSWVDLWLANMRAAFAPK